jgi:hypothetical protein
MATTNDNNFLDVLNDSVMLGGYTSQTSKKTYAPSTKVQAVKIEAILRNIKSQFANGSDICMEGLAQLNTIANAMTKLKDICADFQATEKDAREARMKRNAQYDNHPTVEQTPLSKVAANVG